MASWNELSEEIRSARDGHEQVRHKYLKKFQEERCGRNVIAYYSGFLHNGQNRGNTGIEDRDKNAFMSLSIGKRDAKDSPTGMPREGVKHENGLDLILHTGGGNISAAESIMDFLIDLYRGDVEVFVPQMAMSAGTIMACGARAIHMGTYSSLGPIDPHTDDGIPVWAILEDFKEIKRDIAASETNYLAWLPILSKYRVGLISACNVLNDLSASIATKWLKRNDGMFSDLPDDERDKKAEEIVGQLSNYSRLKSHDRHISMAECKKEIGFGDKIIDLAGDPSYDNMKNALLSYHQACEHTLRDKKVSKIIENHIGHVIYMFDKPKPASTPMAGITNFESFKKFMEQEEADLIATKKPATEQ